MMKCRLLALSERHARRFLPSFHPSFPGLSLHPFFSSFQVPFSCLCTSCFLLLYLRVSWRRPLHLHLLSFSAPPTFVLPRTLSHLSAISFACPPLPVFASPLFFPLSFCLVTSPGPLLFFLLLGPPPAESIGPRSPRKRLRPVPVKLLQSLQTSQLV